MLLYTDGTVVREGDKVRHAEANAVVEEIIVDEKSISAWGVGRPGVMLMCEQCGNVFVEPGDYDWEDVTFISRG